FGIGVVVLLAACNESAVSVENKVDSLGEKLGDKAEQAWDSTKEGFKDLKNRAGAELDSLRERNRERDNIDSDTAN
ncbi:MAG TPA: hypothetical protein VHK69_14875, partial [Chitinophagaceae bacterium]|nr:hypothetical protein [Chitinophagaceae bacterium]